MTDTTPIAGKPRVVILGEAKSGTSALFFKLKNSMPQATRCLFEPPGYRYLKEPGDDRRPVLAKILFGNPALFGYSTFAGFDKKIFIIRDPRDRLISEMLYWVNESAFWNDAAKLDRYMELLRRKEEEPGSISVIDLIATGRRFHDAGFHWEQWALRTEQRFVWLFDFLGQATDYFLFKYEDLVADSLGDLEAYIGFPLRGKAEVTGWAEIVVRTKDAGDWKNWFLAEDVAYFRPLLEKPLRRLGYAEDWTLSPRPVIPSRFCSGYVKKTLDIRRQAQRRAREGGNRSV